jgi:hypothetical protein
MRVREARIALGILAACILLACGKEVKVPTANRLESNSGNCAGCWPNAEEGLFSFVARTDADYEVLTEKCLQTGYVRVPRGSLSR